MIECRSVMDDVALRVRSRRRRGSQNGRIETGGCALAMLVSLEQTSSMTYAEFFRRRPGVERAVGGGRIPGGGEGDAEGEIEGDGVGEGEGEMDRRSSLCLLLAESFSKAA